MKILAQIERINYLDKLIRNRSTGRPERLAGRLGISVSRLYQVIEELRLYDAPIEYSRSLQTYYYKYGFEMQITVVLRPLTREESKTITGGAYCLNKMSHYNFIIASKSTLA